MVAAHVTADRAALEVASRQGAQAVYLGGGRILCRVLASYPLYADAHDVDLTPHLCLNGYWESWITVAIARTLRPGWHCLDVGANHGYYTVLMADAVGPSGRVTAIEPNPRVAELIGLTLEVNGLAGHATVVRQAAFDTDGEPANLVFPPHHTGVGTLLRERRAEEVVVPVETVTLDRLTQDWPRVDFVKIDAEGAEEAIWRGMRKLVRRNPRVIVVMEAHFGRYPEPRAFIDAIGEQGFCFRHVDYDAQIREVSADDLLADRDWMLYLERP